MIDNMELITINHPKQINSRTTYKAIEAALQNHKSKEVHLCINFIAPDNVTDELARRFQVIKNKIAFKLRG